MIATIAQIHDCDVTRCHTKSEPFQLIEDLYLACMSIKGAFDRAIDMLLKQASINGVSPLIKRKICNILNIINPDFLNADVAVHESALPSPLSKEEKAIVPQRKSGRLERGWFYRSDVIKMENLSLLHEKFPFFGSKEAWRPFALEQVKKAVLLFQENRAKKREEAFDRGLLEQMGDYLKKTYGYSEPPNEFKLDEKVLEICQGNPFYIKLATWVIYNEPSFKDLITDSRLKPYFETGVWDIRTALCLNVIDLQKDPIFQFESIKEEVLPRVLDNCALTYPLVKEYIIASQYNIRLFLKDREKVSSNMELLLARILPWKIAINQRFRKEHAALLEENKEEILKDGPKDWIVEYTIGFFRCESSDVKHPFLILNDCEGKLYYFGPEIARAVLLDVDYRFSTTVDPSAFTIEHFQLIQASKEKIKAIPVKDIVYFPGSVFNPETKNLEPYVILCYNGENSVFGPKFLEPFIASPLFLTLTQEKKNQVCSYAPFFHKGMLTLDDCFHATDLAVDVLLLSIAKGWNIPFYRITMFPEPVLTTALETERHPLYCEMLLRGYIDREAFSTLNLKVEELYFLTIHFYLEEFTGKIIHFEFATDSGDRCAVARIATPLMHKYFFRADVPVRPYDLIDPLISCKMLTLKKGLSLSDHQLSLLIVHQKEILSGKISTNAVLSLDESHLGVRLDYDPLLSDIPMIIPSKTNFINRAKLHYNGALSLGDEFLRYYALVRELILSSLKKAPLKEGGRNVLILGMGTSLEIPIEEIASDPSIKSITLLVPDVLSCLGSIASLSKEQKAKITIKQRDIAGVYNKKYLVELQGLLKKNKQYEVFIKEALELLNNMASSFPDCLDPSEKEYSAVISIGMFWQVFNQAIELLEFLTVNQYSEKIRSNPGFILNYVRSEVRKTLSELKKEMQIKHARQVISALQIDGIAILSDTLGAVQAYQSEVKGDELIIKKIPEVEEGIGNVVNLDCLAMIRRELSIVEETPLSHFTFTSLAQWQGLDAWRVGKPAKGLRNFYIAASKK